MSDTDILREKIDSVEAWNSAIVRLSPSGADSLQGARDRIGSVATGQTFPDIASSTWITWWLEREFLRESLGVYSTTSVLDWLNQITLYTYAFHISEKDKDRVAYTASVGDGIADRQIVTTLGKVLRKFLVLATDHYIEALCASHRAELSDELELLSGMDIVDAYKSGSPYSCMAKPFSSYKHHPTEAYDAPNIYMAVMRDSTGRITGRCMVHHTEGRKVCIRNYGNQALAKRLLRLGYQFGDWTGATFKKLPMGSSSDYYFPYLDEEGGMARGSSCVVIMDGVMKAVSKDYANRLKTALGSPSFVNVNGSSSGYITLREAHSSMLQVMVQVTGEMVNILDVPEIKTYFVNGERLRSFLDPEEVGRRFNAEFVLAYDVLTSIYAPRECTFMHRTKIRLDTEDTRRVCGFVKLSAKFYPEMANLWVEGSRDLVNIGDELVYRKDSVIVIDRDLLLHFDWAPRWTKERLKAEGYVKVHTVKGLPTYAPKERVSLTYTGHRKVVKGVHEVKVNCLDGSVDFPANLERTSRLGLFYRQDQIPAGEQPYTVISKSLLAQVASSGDFFNLVYETRRLTGVGAFYVGGGAVLRSALKSNVDGFKISAETFVKGFVEWAKESHYDSGVSSIISLVRYNVEMLYAEAMAIDYNMPTVDEASAPSVEVAEGPTNESDLGWVPVLNSGLDLVHEFASSPYGVTEPLVEVPYSVSNPASADTTTSLSSSTLYERLQNGE